MKYVVRARKNPQDKAASPKWYPAPVYEGDVTTEDFAKDVADMCSLTPMDVIACMRSFITFETLSKAILQETHKHTQGGQNAKHKHK